MRESSEALLALLDVSASDAAINELRARFGSA